MHDEWNDLGIFSNMRSRIEEGEGITNIVYKDIGHLGSAGLHRAVERCCGCHHLSLVLTLHQLVGDFTPNH